MGGLFQLLDGAGASVANWLVSVSGFRGTVEAASAGTLEELRAASRQERERVGFTRFMASVTMVTAGGDGLVLHGCFRLHLTGEQRMPRLQPGSCSRCCPPPPTTSTRLLGYF